MSLNVRQQLPVPDVDPDQVRERADDIMARAEFSNTESILDRAGRWLSELFSGLFDGLAGGGAGWVVGLVILAGLGAAAAWLVVQLRPVASRGASERAGVAIALVSAPDSESRSAEDWAAEAERLIDEGCFDAALRARYRSLLAGLFESGLLEDTAGRTAGEYQRELASVIPEVGPRFDDLTGRFEIVWYGPRDATAADVDRFTVAVQDLVAGLPA